MKINRNDLDPRVLEQWDPAEDPCPLVFIINRLLGVVGLEGAARLFFQKGMTFH